MQTKVRKDPFLTYNFHVEISGIIVGGFTEISGLEIEIEFENVEEGGVNDYVHKLPKQVKHKNLVFRYGLANVDNLWEWFKKCSQGKIERKNGTIYLLDHTANSSKWKAKWDFYDAYPVRWSGPNLNASRNEVAFNSIEIVHNGLEQSVQ